MVNIGWIGTGVMGSSMCKYSSEIAENTYIYTRTKEKANKLLDDGAIWCNSIKELSKKCDIIFSIVGFPNDVEEIYLGENGIINNAKENTILVDMTTSEPSLAKKIYQKAKENKLYSLDAPVSGGDLGAKNATLVIMVGGDKEIYEKVYPFFEKMGSNIAHMGCAGNGQHTKMANQISIATNILGTVETLLYAQKAGLDLNETIRIVGGGSAASWQLNNMGPRILNQDFNPGFYIKHFIKDMKITLEECEKMNLDLKGLKLVYDIYEKSKKYENLGTQALFKILDEVNNSNK